MSDTPVGERPSTGGRVRQFNSDADRARAWRERQKQQRNDVQGVAVPPGLAEATLGSVLERIGEVFAAHQVTAGDLVARIEEAIAALADPDAVAEEMETVRAETARQVAEIQERLARAQQAKAAAETAAREAENAANAAWESAEALGADLDQQTAARTQAETAAAAAVEALDAARRAHQTALADLQRGHNEDLDEQTAAHRAVLEAGQVEHDRAVAELIVEHDRALAQLHADTSAAIAAAEARATDAERQQAWAEGVAAEIREELEHTRAELAALTEAVPTRIDAVRAEVTENLSIRHQLELDAITASHQGQIGRLEAQLDTATAQTAAAERIAQIYQQETERLTHQLNQPSRPTRARRNNPETSD